MQVLYIYYMAGQSIHEMVRSDWQITSPYFRVRIGEIECFFIALGVVGFAIVFYHCTNNDDDNNSNNNESSTHTLRF